MRDDTEIEAWQWADDLTVSLYDAMRMFPGEELKGLTFPKPLRCVFGASEYRETESI